MSQAIVVNGEEFWSPDDEAYLQDHIDAREEAEKQQKEARDLWRQRLGSRYGEHVTVSGHPFGTATIKWELSESPGWFLCVFANGYEAVIHVSNLTTNGSTTEL